MDVEICIENDVLAINSDEIILIYIYSSLLPPRHEAGHRISSRPTQLIYTSPSPTQRSTLPDTPIIHSSPIELNPEAGADHSYLKFIALVYISYCGVNETLEARREVACSRFPFGGQDCIWILLHLEAFLSSMHIYYGLFTGRWSLTTVMQW
jgi:hypothetical protein